MSKKIKAKVAISTLLAILLACVVGFYLASIEVAILGPKSILAQKEEEFFVSAAKMTMIVVIAIFFVTWFFTWNHRLSSKKTTQGAIKVAIFTLAAIIVAFLVGLYLASLEIAVLNPKGLIAQKEKELLLDAAKLMLIIVIPVFFMTWFFTWKYRAGNTKSTYAPDWDYNLKAEILWWGAPGVIVVILSIMTYVSTYELDPYKPIHTGKKPLTIQVVALQWKWLFIYPEQNIASVNFFQFPKETPLNFEITSDAPMNSFWIPQLGSQMYAMAGMKSLLHLIANETGEFRGSSANLSGEGFAKMNFIAKATTEDEFDEWVSAMQKSKSTLNLKEYKALALPAVEYPVAAYTLKQKNLFDWILMKYMIPMPKTENAKTEEE